MHEDIWCDGDSAPGGPSERTWTSSMSSAKRFESAAQLDSTYPTFPSEFKLSEVQSELRLKKNGQQFITRRPQIRPATRTEYVDDSRYVELEDTGALSENNASLPNVLSPFKGLLNEGSARSVEELTRRKRKLDHLQCCLNRYEIERVEAGQAVRRIEERLIELKMRTADLLGYSNNQHAVQSNLHQQMNQGSNRPGSRNLPGTRTNWMYVDAEDLFDPLVSEVPLTTPYTTMPQDAFNSLARNPYDELYQLDEWVQPIDWAARLAEQSGQHTPVTRKRLQEIQKRHAVLLEHLERQRNRLASADATVANLAQTLIQLSIRKTGKAVRTRTHGSREKESDKHLFKPIPKKRNSSSELDLPIAPYPGYLSDISSARFPGSTEASVVDDAKHHTFGSWGKKNAVMQLASRPLLRDGRNADYIALYETDSKPSDVPISKTSSAFHTIPFRSGFSNTPSVNAPLYPRPVIPFSPPMLEVPPPLPPKPARRTTHPSSEAECPQTLEDEEVSKLMDSTEDRQIGSASKTQTVSNPMNSCSTKRPPPPPYYVNLFVSEAKPLWKELNDGVSNSDGMIWPSSDDKAEVGSCRKLENIQPSGPRRFVPPSQLCPINLNEYLVQAGHPLEQLLLPGGGSTTLQVTQPSQQFICFNSIFNRWFRTGSHRVARDKQRARSLDEHTAKFPLSVSPSRLAMELDFRVRLTRTRCEGHMWIANTAHQKASHLRPRGWHSLRSTADTRTYSSHNFGRRSPAAGRKRQNQYNWRQRWLVCDFDYRILAVCDEQNDSKQRDCIPFATLRAIHCGNDLDPNQTLPASPLVPSRQKTDQHFNDTFSQPVPRLPNDSQTAEKNSESIENCIFRIECTNKMYTMRTSSTDLRNLWITVLELAKEYGGPR